MNRFYRSLTAMLLVGTSIVGADSLDISAIVDGVVASDPEIENADISSQTAMQRYRETLAAVRPDVTLSLSPYSYSAIRVDSGTFAADYQNHTVGAGVSIQQLLPTSGLLALEATNDLTFQSGDEEAVELSPSLSVTWAQPLFVAGSPIDTSLFRATRRNAEIGYLLSQESYRLERNQRVRAALDLFVQAATLRRSIELLETTLDVLTRKIEDAEINVQQGLISDNALLALRVTRNTQRAALLNSRLALVQVEQGLARAIGIDELDGSTAFVDDFPVVDVAALTDDTLEDNPSLAIGRLGVEQARLANLFNGSTDRPEMSVVFSAQPVYPANRDDPADAATALPDLFSDDAAVDTVVSLNVSIPLLTRRERSYREEVDRLAERAADIRLSDTERAVSNSLHTLLLNRSILTERLELLQVEIEYEAERVENEATLLTAGASTQLSVDEVTVDLLSRQNERWQIEAELFLNALDILSVTGVDISAFLLE